MATSTQAASTIVEDASYGTGTWINESNAGVDDANAASGQDDTITHYLKFTNFGFSIPSGSTINGIEITIRRRNDDAADDNTVDSRVRLVKAGTVQTTDKADLLTNWPASATNATYGGSADLWSDTWSSSDINASNFGFVISANVARLVACEIEYATITIDYTYTPKSDETLKSDADTELTSLWSSLQSLQTSYESSNSRYWQGLWSHDTIPTDNALTSLEVGSTVPSDISETWATFWAALTEAGGNLRVDVFGPGGADGYALIMRVKAVSSGNVFEKRKYSSTYSDVDWFQINEDETDDWAQWDYVLDPTSNNTENWNVFDYSNIAKDTEQPTTPSTGTYCYADRNDDLESQAWNWVHGFSTVTQVVVWFYADALDEAAGDITVGVKVDVDGNGYETTQNQIVANTSPGWYSKTFTGSWDAANPIKAAIDTPNMGIPDELAVYAVYLDITGK